jgi:hypothetical protein
VNWVGRGLVLSALVWLGTIAAAIAQGVPPSPDGGQIPQLFGRPPELKALPSTDGTAIQPPPDDRFVFARNAPFQREGVDVDLPNTQTSLARRKGLIPSRRVKTIASSVAVTATNSNVGDHVGENAAALAGTANQPVSPSKPPTWTTRSSLGSNPDNKLLALGSKKRSKRAAERADSPSERRRKPGQRAQAPRPQSAAFDPVRPLICRIFAPSSCYRQDRSERADPAVARKSLPKRTGRGKKQTGEVPPRSRPARPRWQDARVAATPRVR